MSLKIITPSEGSWTKGSTYCVIPVTRNSIKLKLTYWDRKRIDPGLGDTSRWQHKNLGSSSTGHPSLDALPEKACACSSWVCWLLASVSLGALMRIGNSGILYPRLREAHRAFPVGLVELAFYYES